MSKYYKRSRGYLKDLACLHLAMGILKVAKDEAEASVRHGDNKNYHANKKIDRRIDRIFSVASENGQNLSSKDAQYVEKLREKVLRGFVAYKFNKKPSYEFIAVYMLYLRFIDGRTKPLDQRFDFIKSGDLFDISIAVQDLGIEDDGQEYEAAKRIVAGF